MMTPVLSSITSMLVCATLLGASDFVFAQSTGGAATLAITEIMFNPPESGNDSLEYLELFNYGNVAVDMSGFTFMGIELVIPNGVPGFEPGEYKIIAIDAIALSNVLSVNSFEWTDGALSNDGEGLSIRDGQGNLVDTVYFDDTVAWPPLANGNGASLERCDPLSDGTLPASWVASTTLTGALVNGTMIFASPGEENSECLAVGIDTPVITTVMAHPNPSASGEFLLTVPVNGTVYDVVGQMVKQINATRVVDLSKVPAGQYVLRTDVGQIIRLMK